MRDLLSDPHPRHTFQSSWLSPDAYTMYTHMCTYTYVHIHIHTCYTHATHTCHTHATHMPHTCTHIHTGLFKEGKAITMNLITQVVMFTLGIITFNYTMMVMSILLFPWQHCNLPSLPRSSVWLHWWVCCVTSSFKWYSFLLFSPLT